MSQASPVWLEGTINFYNCGTLTSCQYLPLPEVLLVAPGGCFQYFQEHVLSYFCIQSPLCNHHVYKLLWAPQPEGDASSAP